MRHLRNPVASREAAKSARRAELRACASGPRPLTGEVRGESWRRPLRRSRQAIDSSLRLVETSRHVIDTAETFSAARTARNTRQLQHASRWLADAAARLQLAAHGLEKTNHSIALSPETAAGAPARIIETTARWVDAAAQVAEVSDRLEETFGKLLQFARGLVVPIAPEAPAVEVPLVEGASAGTTVADAALATAAAGDHRPVRPLFLHAPSRTGVLLLTPVRRQGHAFTTLADAARRISRGRAPPPLPTCSL